MFLTIKISVCILKRFDLWTGVWLHLNFTNRIFFYHKISLVWVWPFYPSMPSFSSQLFKIQVFYILFLLLCLVDDRCEHCELDKRPNTYIYFSLNLFKNCQPLSSAVLQQSPWSIAEITEPGAAGPGRYPASKLCRWAPSPLKMAAFTHFWQIITTEGYQTWSVWHLRLGSYGQSFGICAIFKKLVGRLGRRHDLRWTLKEQVLKSKREKKSVG